MNKIQTTLEDLCEYEYNIERATTDDIDELEKLYNELNDYLESGTNYAGWKKGVYPVRQTAIDGIEEDSLFVLKINKKIAGSIVLNNKQDPVYSEGVWSIDADVNKVMVVHTLSISPKYNKRGIGKKLIEFARSYGEGLGMKSIRLDVSIQNTPAISLYEKCGYRYIGTVDLGLKLLNKTWFRLYELLL